MRPIHLVGSIPLEGVADVFRTVASALGTAVSRVPDGEIGDRRQWIRAQWPILVSCPALELVPGAKPDHATSTMLPLRLRPKFSEASLVFGPLNYARYARASYFVFRALKEAGAIPKEWRFQVSLPTPFAVLASFVEQSSRALIEPSYEKAMLEEVTTVASCIPHDELAISWDVAIEMQLWEYPNDHKPRPHFEDIHGGILQRLTRLGAAVPSTVQLGYHLCYGDQNHKHTREPRDAAAMTDLASRLSAQSARPINFIHMPVPRDRLDEAFYEPLDGLSLDQGTVLFLGLVHYTDGIEGTRKRIDLARRHVTDFGVATECGFGRRPPDTIPKLLDIHRLAAAY